MPVEFDPPENAATTSPDEPIGPVAVAADEPGEALAAPRRLRRGRVIFGSAAAVAVVAGAVAIGLASSSASASPASIVAAAASSSAATGTAPSHPTGPGARGLMRPGQPFLFGTVKKVSGSTILITDQQGFTRTIVTSSKTTYKDGLTVLARGRHQDRRPGNGRRERHLARRDDDLVAAEGVRRAAWRLRRRRPGSVRRRPSERAASDRHRHPTEWRLPPG